MKNCIAAFALETIRSTKIQIEKWNRSGEKLSAVSGHFIEPKEQESAIRKLGITVEQFTEILAKYNESDKKSIVTIPLVPVHPLPFFNVRYEAGDSIITVNDFGKALYYAESGTVIEWNDTYHVCNLDIDFHSDEMRRPDADMLLTFIHLLHPSPLYYWLSKSGGAHLIYTSSDTYRADEIAAIAAYQITRRFPTAGAEFLSRTRAIPDESVCYKLQPDHDISCVKSLLTMEGSEEESEAWLTERGWAIGMRLPHTDCPVNPSTRGVGNTNPVVIRNGWVQCYICQSDGITLGSKKPGVFPIHAIAGTRVNTQIAKCINGFVHWGHAQHIINGYIGDNRKDMGRLLYTALLKLKYGPDDPRIVDCFNAANPFGLIRFDGGYWCTGAAEPIKLEKGSPILRSLPAANDMLPNGTTSTNLERVEWLSQPISLDHIGYFPITPIHGFQLTRFQTLPTNKIYSVLHHPLLQSDDMADRRPVYVSEKNRMSKEEAWKIIESAYPLVDKKLIELLIIGRGCKEHRTGLPPMLTVTGHTGVGKTSHIELASAIVGDSVGVVHISKDRDRYLNKLITAKRESGFVLFDEFWKMANEEGIGEIEASESLLAFTESSQAYMIYVGAVKFGSLPFFIWADTEIPNEVKGHQQIGRRVFCHRLNRTLSWEQSLTDNGISGPSKLRAEGSPEIIQAANCILSHIVDEWFCNNVGTDFAVCAEEMGFKRIRDSGVTSDKNELVKDLFDAICNAEPITDPLLMKRWGKTFKVANLDGNCPLFTAFELCQVQHELRTTACRVISETDLMKVLGLKSPTIFECRKHGSKLAMRFISEDGKSYNEGLKK